MRKSFQPTWQRRGVPHRGPSPASETADFLRLFASQGVYWMHARRASYLLHHGQRRYCQHHQNSQLR